MIESGRTEEIRNALIFWSENLKIRNHSEHLDVN
jgi:hypothetical protein